jgi:hypothetical protein
VALPAAVCAGVGLIPTGDSASIPYRPLAAAVRSVTDRDDTVFVWGNLPEIYCLSGREPATRFIHTGFLTGNSGGRPNGRSGPNEAMPGAWTMLGADFRARLPDLVVDTTDGDIRQSAYYPMSKTWLGPLVRANYRLVDTLDGVRLYALNIATE